MSSTSASLYMTQVRFCRALAVVRSLPTESGGSFQPSIADRLKFYGLYKQTLAGDCMLMKPSSKHIVQYAKWLDILVHSINKEIYFLNTGNLGIDYEVHVQLKLKPCIFMHSLIY